MTWQLRVTECARGNYLIVYRVDVAERCCELVRVVHGARRWADLIA